MGLQFSVARHQGLNVCSDSKCDFQRAHRGKKLTSFNIILYCNIVVAAFLLIAAGEIASSSTDIRDAVPSFLYLTCGFLALMWGSK